MNDAFYVIFEKIKNELFLKFIFRTSENVITIIMNTYLKHKHYK